MDGSTDIPLCDNEPIHIPGSIQPHGIMLVAARDGLMVWQVAGEAEDWLGVPDWQGAPLSALLGAELVQRIVDFVGDDTDGQAPSHVGYIGQLRTVAGHLMDVSAYLTGLAGTDARDTLVVELEPASDDGMSAALVLDRLERSTADFQRAGTLDALCRAAAVAFRRLTGFDRVMIYRFGEDESGRVLAEDKCDHLHSFLNHQFPASDIPAQARALYLRNLVRVIPDIHYTAAVLFPAAPGRPLDLSDSSLRSVSPIHLQYLFNMGVRASASFSIVKNDTLWGLVACHNESVRRIPYEIRIACRTLAATLSREVRAREEADGYRQRLRLRTFEDDVVRLLSRQGTLDDALARHAADVQRAMSADGVAVLRGDEVVTGGNCPPDQAVRAVADWVLSRAPEMVQSTDRLAELYPPGDAIRESASGLLAMILSAPDRWLVLWFRAEQIEVVNWAGNPHKDNNLSPNEQLTPRASFEDWKETVYGRARRWTMPEIEAAGRLRGALLDVRQRSQLQDLNRQLTAILADKDQLLQQKEFLIGEVNHRVQNSLQLVGSFLSLQAHGSSDPALVAVLDEARRRLSAVALVHRRLYSGDQVELINAARYIEELCHDAVSSMGQEWLAHLTLELAPLMIHTDRAVTLGLVLTELLINIGKYAYGGAGGAITVTLMEDRAHLVLTVADAGCGRQSAGSGFGTRLINALVGQLQGELQYEDNRPGLRAILTAPLNSTADATARMHAAN